MHKPKKGFSRRKLVAVMQLDDVGSIQSLQDQHTQRRNKRVMQAFCLRATEPNKADRKRLLSGMAYLALQELPCIRPQLCG